jgi:hypothetical protein
MRLRRAQHGVRNAGVAAGGVEQAATRAELLALERVKHDSGRGAVFDGASRIIPFRLPENLDAGKGRREAFQAEQGRIADPLEERGSGETSAACDK